MGKVAVAAVVLNRVKSPSFPNTISGVIYQSGAFDAVADGQINLTPDEDSLRAARDALNGLGPHRRLPVLLQSGNRHQRVDLVAHGAAEHRQAQLRHLTGRRACG